MPENKKTKRGKGRPSAREKWTLSEWERFGYFHASKTTISELLGCSIDTIIREFQRQESEFCNAYNNGFANAKMRLSEAQMNLALAGHAGMLIWLGKQYLEQTDKIENSGAMSFDGKITINGFDPENMRIPDRIKSKKTE